MPVVAPTLSLRVALRGAAELVGGECTYWACIPSEGFALIRPLAM